MYEYVYIHVLLIQAHMCICTSSALAKFPRIFARALSSTRLMISSADNVGPSFVSAGGSTCTSTLSPTSITLLAPAIAPLTRIVPSFVLAAAALRENPGSTVLTNLASFHPECSSVINIECSAAPCCASSSITWARNFSRTQSRSEPNPNIKDKRSFVPRFEKV